MNSIELLVQLASLQTAFLTLDEAIKTTNRRVNALDNVVRPKLENTIQYIKVCFLVTMYIPSSVNITDSALAFDALPLCIIFSQRLAFTGTANGHLEYQSQPLTTRVLTFPA